MVKEGFYLVVVVLIIAVVAGIVGFVSPKLTEASNAIVDITAAPQRAQARIENENALNAARIAEMNARIEISKTNAAANAYALQKQADAQIIKLQSDSVRVAEDAQTMRNLINGVIVLFGALGLGCGAAYTLPKVLAHRRDTKEIEARKVLMLEAIKQTQSGAIVSVALDNKHSFKIERPAALPATLNAPQLSAPSACIDTPLSTRYNRLVDLSKQNTCAKRVFESCFAHVWHK